MKMMKNILRLIECLLAVLLAGACQRDVLLDRNPEDRPCLNLYIYPSDRSMVTRADEGYVDAYAQERAVKKLQIWIFRSGGSLFRYLEPESNNLASGNEEKYQIVLTDAEGAELKTTPVDIYVLANGESIGSTLGESSTPAQIKALVMSGDYFGTASPTIDISEKGLPMSGYEENVSVQGALPVLTLPVVKLTRCVSKIRFVFTQNAQEGIPFSINSIKLNGGLISAEETVFTKDPYKLDGYVPGAVDLPLPIEIVQNDNPLSLAFQPGQDPQVYEDLVDEAVRKREASQVGPVYFRESDKRLAGSISYQANGVDRVLNFVMDGTDEGNKNFSRNHTWIVYAYFIGGELYIKPTVLPWIAGQDWYEYKVIGSTEMKYDRPWLRYDRDDRKRSTWEDSFLAIAYGYSGGNAGIPTRSPRITFETYNTNELRIQLNNEHFLLVHVTHGTDAGGNPTDIYTKLSPGAHLIIPGSTSKQTTEVYVVPVNDDPMADPYVDLVLTEVYPAGIPPENIPFNHNLPGDDDHTCIRFYNPGATDWDTGHQNARTNQDLQNDNFWREEDS